jgi:hypothetical protein
MLEDQSLLPVAYTVTAAFPTAAAREEFIAWLRSGHVQGVLAGGAISASVVRVDEPDRPVRAQACYVFPNPAVFRTYLSDHAPSLREEGLRRFPPDSGVRFERQVGTIVEEVGPAGE